MFKKNLEAIKIKNPKLAERLEKIDINSITGIEVFESESKDLIISYNNTPLHSTIDPVREAKTTWNRTVVNELKKTDIQLVFGLGLGYLFKRAYVSADSKVYIIEPFIEVIRFVLQHVDFSTELSDPRVYITDNVGDIYEKLQQEYLSGDRLEFLFLNQYAVLNQEILQNLTSKAFEIIEGRGSDENTILYLNNFWTRNFIKNIVHFSEARPLGFFEGKFSDKTALILSAGPSLADDIELIKANQDKFVIFAVGKAFKTVINAGIIPDFTVFADARDCYKQIKGVEDAIEKTNLILLAKTDYFVYELKSKTKIIYFTENCSMSKLFKDSDSKNPGFYNSGSSVSIISYYAAKAMGFSKIVFSGLDLAFIDNKIYSDAQTLEDNIAFNKLLNVKDKDGNKLLTRADYAWFIRQLSEILTEEVNLAKVINTSLKGAFIEGMDYVKFSDVLSSLSEVKPDIDNIISTIYAETKQNWAINLINTCEKINQAKEELEKIDINIAEIANEFAQINDDLSEHGKTDYDSNVFDTLNNKAVEIRQKIINNVLIMYAMQKTIWHYTKNYVIKSLPSREEIISNISFDNYFFKNAKLYNTYLIENLNETLNCMELKQKVSSK